MTAAAPDIAAQLRRDAEEFATNDPRHQRLLAVAAQIDDFTKRLNALGAREALRGTWPNGVQRAFVDGAKWWQFRANGATAFPSEVDEMEAEAVRRFGEPSPAPTGSAS